MTNKLRASGILFAAVFALAILVAGGGAYLRTRDLAFVLGHPVNMILAAAAVLFLVSAYVERLRWLQPVLFLAMAPLAIINDSRNIYGLGFFIVGVLLLERAGFFL